MRGFYAMIENGTAPQSACVNIKKGRPSRDGLAKTCFLNRLRELGAIHILCLEPLGPLLDLELHFGALLERPVAGHLNRREVDEHILAAGALDKSIALCGVKPFHNTLFSHYSYLLFHSRRSGTNPFPP